MCKNHLTSNLKKTVNMCFGTAQNLKQIGTPNVEILNDIRIDRVQNFKYLGVMLDHKSTFNAHVDYIRSKSIPRLKII